MTAVYRHQSSSSAAVEDATLEQSFSSSKKRRISQTSASDEKVSNLGSGSATVGKQGPTNATTGETEDPKEVLGKTVGPFRFTSKQHFYKSGGQYGGWEAACPFHKKNDKTLCRKWFGIAGPTHADRKSAAAAAMLWCSRARQFERQRLHIAFQPDFASAPDAGLTRLLPIFKEARPRNCTSDEDLDSAQTALTDLAPDGAPLASLAKSKAKAKGVRPRSNRKALQAETVEEGAGSCAVMVNEGITQAEETMDTPHAEARPPLRPKAKPKRRAIAEKKSASALKGTKMKSLKTYNSPPLATTSVGDLHRRETNVSDKDSSSSGSSSSSDNSDSSDSSSSESERVSSNTDSSSNSSSRTSN